MTASVVGDAFEQNGRSWRMPGAPIQVTSSKCDRVMLAKTQRQRGVLIGVAALFGSEIYTTCQGKIAKSNKVIRFLVPAHAPIASNVSSIGPKVYGACGCSALLQAQSATCS